MSQECIIFLVLFNFLSVCGYAGETIMVLPPFEVRTVDRYPEAPFQVNRNPQHQQQVLHTNAGQKPPQLPMKRANTGNAYFNNFAEVLNELSLLHDNGEGTSQLRAAASADQDDHEPAYHPYPGPYTGPNSAAYAPNADYTSNPSYGSKPIYQNSSPVALPRVPALPKLPLLKPDLSTLFKPVTTKVSSKVSGLLGLILALFTGSSPDGLQLNGVTDLVINGIVKPLLIAKGGIKSLISKLSIPIIALLLINLEVLITVWWLWDECPVQKVPVQTYSYPKPPYNYNNYNKYR